MQAPRSSNLITHTSLQIVRTQFNKLIACEKSATQGDTSETIHDMRVAVRHIRLAFQLLSPYLPTRGAKRVRKSLRVLAQKLGEVRDLDVFIANTRIYVDSLPTERGQAIAPLITTWLAQRHKAHHNLVCYLNTKPYQQLKTKIDCFMAQADESDTTRVCDIVPMILWQQYGLVRAYEPHLNDAPLPTLHELRIQCKRLRYGLEFFQDILGDETSTLIKSLTKLQDQLGQLHDTAVAYQQITDFNTKQRKSVKRGIHQALAIETTAYLTVLQNRISELRASVFSPWQAIVAPSFRQTLAHLVADL